MCLSLILLCGLPAASTITAGYKKFSTTTARRDIIEYALDLKVVSNYHSTSSTSYTGTFCDGDNSPINPFPVVHIISLTYHWYISVGILFLRTLKVCQKGASRHRNSNLLCPYQILKIGGKMVISNTFRKQRRRLLNHYPSIWHVVQINLFCVRCIQQKPSRSPL